jgi:hypothetical protein
MNYEKEFKKTVCHLVAVRITFGNGVNRTGHRERGCHKNNHAKGGSVDRNSKVCWRKRLVNHKNLYCWKQVFSITLTA